MACRTPHRSATPRQCGHEESTPGVTGSRMGDTVNPRRLVVLASVSVLAFGLLTGAAAAVPTHNDGNGGKKRHAPNMPGMTKAEMAAMDDAANDDKGLSLLENG